MHPLHLGHDICPRRKASYLRVSVEISPELVIWRSSGVDVGEEAVGAFDPGVREDASKFAARRTHKGSLGLILVITPRLSYKYYLGITRSTRAEPERVR